LQSTNGKSRGGDTRQGAPAGGGHDGGARYKSGACHGQGGPAQAGGKRNKEENGPGRNHAARKRSSSGRSKSSGSSVTEKRRGSASASGSKSGSGSASGSNSNQDEIIHFDWQQGMVMNSRYKLSKLLGDGTFGRVVLAHDQRCNREVAIKIIRDVKRYMENAKIEADILKDICKEDPHAQYGCAMMYDTFMYNTRHFCIVCEPLGVSLYDFLKNNGFRGFWVEDIQSFARQSMQALGFLHGHLRMTHTDLKPENILLKSMEPAQPSHFPREAEMHKLHPSSSSSKSHKTQYMRPANSQIKLIDFGNATYEDEHHSSIINTRQYRGPEVLMELGWNELSDQWSIACILMELYAGEQLFATHDELEHLALMSRIVGTLPSSMLDRSSQSVKDRWLSQDSRTGHWRLPWPDRASSPSSERHVFSQRPLPEHVLPQHKPLAEFVGALLSLDPGKRPSAVDALSHPFFDVRFRD